MPVHGIETKIPRPRVCFSKSICWSHRLLPHTEEADLSGERCLDGTSTLLTSQWVLEMLLNSLRIRCRELCDRDSALERRPMLRLGFELFLRPRVYVSVLPPDTLAMVLDDNDVLSLLQLNIADRSSMCYFVKIS